ncbi:amino acid adenylation domain-containing protein [Actinoplanes sp. SE50]|uniref:non-ribosomal peptide synthetase n=1 Tax=unclassified Actinoplanes TaxID=2626549 RepID=UPI00023EC3E1|nr:MULTISPECIES: non-ribosomal peptide synthetase [unclassified Actinoplanes]AEV81910.1 amino acid adenylation domain-containing protein [Actinoplanes sp. SE50/110]ATO80310.1 amino acid adenylation domain-containing protein [Actinoplanes sp. SE50]SLL97715.1 non-ribosomal peptide synthetase [Actinoplanes sp. SE50/110]
MHQNSPTSTQATTALTPELIGSQAVLTPDAVAVVDGVRRLTYRELDTRSAQFAHHLRERGAGPGTHVGVLLGRGLDLIAGLLGIWRAGAAYLPLDPTHPQGRLTGILTASGCGLVLCDPADAVRVTTAGAEPVHLSAAAGHPATAPAVDRGADDIAYVEHTSGSTGVPKGVVVTHGGLANLLGWATGDVGIGAGDRVLQRTSLVYDAHAFEIFAPLTRGGTLVLAPAGDTAPATLLRVIAEHAVTVLQVVPSILHTLVEEDGWAGCGTLRTVVSGGEQLHAEPVERLRRLVPGVVVWNVYGPTETTINSIATRVDPAQTTGPVPIGRPLPRTRVQVVDEHGRVVGVGVPGELLIGGAGLARGYLGRPGLTAERFLPDPLAKDGGRVYRTGDGVRWRADGQLEYLGRLDDQVKVNGVRLEPAEIEAALATHPEVVAAAVTTYRLADGAARLVAYVVPRGAAGRELDAALRTHLLDLLPPSHVPGRFVHLAALPQVASGKVDRRALPHPDAAGADDRRTGAVPATPSELLVKNAWQHLLGSTVEGRELTLEDDFFRLGGTSLQLTKLLSDLRGQTGADLSLRSLLYAPTLLAQARLLDDARVGAALPRVPRGGGVPLSSGQQRLWFMDRLNPASPEWMAGLLFRLPAGADRTLAEQALNVLVARHESLRTRYAEVAGEPRQFIRPEVLIEVAEQQVSPAGLADALADLLGRGIALGGDEPLLRAVVLDVADGRRLLAVAMHHITTDGWSAAVLEREFAQVIGALVAGRSPALPALPVQYADFAAWQRDRLTDEVVEAELSYWSTVLDGLQPLTLATDRPRPRVRDGRGSIVPITVAPALVRSLDALAAEAGTTRFTTILALYATVLARFSGQWDIPIGTVVAGRGRAELDGVVGFFLNNLVLRCRLDPAAGVAESVARLGTVTRDAFAHQELPFDVLVDRLVPEPDLSRTPLYQAAFDLHGADFNETVDDDLGAIREMWRVTHTDLTLLLRPTADGGLVGGLEYATSLFDEETADRIAATLEHALTEAAAAPGTPLGLLDTLTDQDAYDLRLWSRGEPAIDGGLVPAGVVEQAGRTPDAVAVRGDGFALTFAELLDRAGAVAGSLRSAGVGRGDLVGVLVERGPWLHAALLGVWLAGAAYVPVDPDFPVTRAQSMLAGAAALVTDASRAGVFDGPVTVLEELVPAAVAPAAIDPDELAYVIYTSGSTGRPKGVAVTHRGLANHVNWAVRDLARAGDGGGAVFSSVAFDLVVPNVWAPLLAGRPVHLLPQDLDLAELGSRLTAAGPFSFLKLTPGHLEVLSHQLSPGEVRDLAGRIVVAGEALQGTLAARYSPSGRLINEYGPTEASVGTCIHPVPADPGTGVVPIGSPLPGMVMRVLDDRLLQVPVGGLGELCVGGTGVARGYVDRPALTAARFVPDPYGPAGSRLYRSGDVVRWRGDGAVEFLGRFDDQVKIRGYRVEIGEIEAVLREHAGVADARILVDDQGGVKRLVACWVPVGPEPVGDDELREHCAGLLPDFMLPAAFLSIAAIPLNANGKVDRAALPDPAPRPESRDAEPLSPVAEFVQQLWRERCGIVAGPRENFFHAGGNSIIAIRLIAAIQDEFGVTLPVRAVFEGPTVVEMAQLIENLIRDEIEQMSDSEVVADLTLSEEPQA